MPILVLAVVSSLGMGEMVVGLVTEASVGGVVGDEMGKVEKVEGVERFGEYEEGEEDEVDEVDEVDEESVLVADDEGIGGSWMLVGEALVEAGEVEVGNIEAAELRVLDGAAWNGMQHIPPGAMVFLQDSKEDHCWSVTVSFMVPLP